MKNTFLLKEKTDEFIKEHALNNESGSLLASTLYLIAFLFVLFIVFLCRNYQIEAIMFSFLSFVFWSVFFILLIRSRSYKIFSYIFVILINFFFIPIYYFLDNTIFNGVELFFCIGVMITFFLIHEKFVYILVGIECVWYISLLVFSATNNESSTYEPNGIGIEVRFLFAAIIPILFMSYQTILYNIHNYNAKMSENMIVSSKENKSKFLSNMTSEIRTPVNAIIGMNELIMREELDPVLKEIDGHIVDSSKHLLKIVNNIFEFSKLESDNAKMFPQKYSFRELIEGVIDAVSNEYGDMVTLFYVNLDPNIPLFLFGDKGRIRQVFMYLLFSSVIKNNRNRLILSVFAERNNADNSVVLKCRIAESGIGISQNEIDTIFSAFTKYDSRLSSSAKGLGLEISICKEILEKMDGYLEVESVEDIGTAVSFAFKNYIISNQPMVSVDSAEKDNLLIYAESKQSQNNWIDALKGFKVSIKFVNGPNAFKKAIQEKQFSKIFIPNEYYDILREIIENFSLEKITYVATDRTHVYSDYGNCRLINYPLNCINVSDALNDIWDEDKYKLVIKKESIIYPKAKILIVDDSFVNLKVLKGLLNSFEIVPDLSKNAEEALEYIKKNFYDLIILDQMMPGTDGIELLHMIRQLPNTNSRIPIICATADFGSDVSRRLLAEGFQDYLAKPVQQFYLERILRRFLPHELAENPVVDNNVIIDTADNKAPEFDPLEMDFEKGKETLGGDLSAYCAVLNTYYKEGIRKTSDIRNELGLDDLSLYVIDVHALKSSSASIGAFGISKLFKDLEFAGRENNRVFIEDNTESTLVLFGTILNKVKDFLVDNNLFIADIDGNPGSNLELEQLSRDIVLEMQDAMNKINLRRCEEIINDISSKNYGDKFNGLIREIKNSYDMFDYHKVKALISDLLGLVDNENGGTV